MTPEDNLRFGLGFLNDARPIDECVLDYVQKLEHLLQKQRKHYTETIDELRKKESLRDSSHVDHIYNQHTIDKTWAIIGNFNKHCLELPDAVREKIRDLTWEARENPINRCTPNLIRILDSAEKIAKSRNEHYLSSKHILLALIKEENPTQEIFIREGFDYDKIEKFLQKTES